MNASVMMSKCSPPSSVCFSTTDDDDQGQENDDHSECTRACCDDDISPPRAKDQDQLDLKLRILRQQEKLDLVLSKLSKFEAENETLNAENTALVDKLAHSNSKHSISRSTWFSKADNNSNNNGGSMQLLLDTNAKLMMDNARLQVMVGTLKRSFQSYIEDNRRDHDKEKQMMKIKALQLENNLLHRRLSLDKNSKLSSSEHTSQTFLDSFLAENDEEDLLHNSDQPSTQDNIQRDSFQSLIPDLEFKSGTSGDDWIIGGDVIDSSIQGMIDPKKRRESIWNKGMGNAPVSRANRSKSVDLLVEFGETETRRSSRVRNRGHSISEGNAWRKSDSLLVDFDESRRAQSKTKRSLSLKL
mmetsp:Transcript_17315/g.31290  ORF Transcript_17315/g.31290 Transcript_17315/m.31290 type:complete len:357 (-) Transcript_17315:99-1169(-)